MTLEIKAAQPGDLAALQGIYTLIGHKPDGYFEQCLALQESGGRSVLIAFLDTTPAGFCILNFEPQYRVYKTLGIPEIQDLNVVPHLRRKGVARALLTHCEGIAGCRGATQIGISVGLSPDYGAAQILYARSGYIPDGYGVTYARDGVTKGQMRPVDDDLCLMLVKDIKYV